MRYTPVSGDTLRSIAARLTLSSEYAAAIAANNGLVSDDTQTVDMDTPLELILNPGQSIEIPNNWLKPGVATGFNGSPVLYAALAFLAYRFLGGKEKRRPRRRRR